MYRIALKNIGKDMVNRDVTVDSIDISMAIVEAFELCVDILGSSKGLVFDVVGEEVNIKCNDVLTGSLTITSLN